MERTCFRALSHDVSFSKIVSQQQISCDSSLELRCRKVKTRIGGDYERSAESQPAISKLDRRLASGPARRKIRMNEGGGRAAVVRI